MSAIVERHGGIVEKYIGDAIMAVFGVPTLHEDDALRAVRAAVEMRDTLAVLNRELEAGWGVRLANRIGVNTGEVIAGDHRQGHLFVTGEAVNVAKRLEEAAAANEILIGEATHRLVRDAVVVEPSGPRALKHGEAIDALAVVDVARRTPPAARAASTRRSSGASASAPCSRRVFDDAVSERALPPADGARRRGRGQVAAGAGVHGGARRPTSTVLHGRCLPYGEGITYWPLAEIVREIARAEGPGPRRAVRGDDRGAARRERWPGRRRPS